MTENSHSNFSQIELPKTVNCEVCGVELNLDNNERANRKYHCPECDNHVDLTDLDGAPVIEYNEQIKGVTCVNHKSVQAGLKCHVCQSAICQTCDFHYPESNLHLCPKCVNESGRKPTERDKTNLMWSLILAGLGVFIFVLFFLAAIGTQSEVVAGVVFLLVIGLNITGVALSTEIDTRNYENTLWVRITQIWHFAMACLGLLMVVLGMFTA